jgi:hypothetical protein
MFVSPDRLKISLARHILINPTSLVIFLAIHLNSIRFNPPISIKTIKAKIITIVVFSLYVIEMWKTLLKVKLQNRADEMLKYINNDLFCC